jgi:HK97 family phage major capsid protein
MRKVIRNGKEYEVPAHEEAAEVLGSTIRAALRERVVDTGRADEVEQEALRGRSPQLPPVNGTFLPWPIMAALLSVRAGQDTKTTGAGGALSYIEPGPFEQLTRMAPVGKHVRTLSVPRGINATIPLMSQNSTSYWLGENAGVDVTQGDPVYAALALTAHQLLVSTTITRQLLRGSSYDVEQQIATDFAKTFALAIDSAIIQGATTTLEPSGILSSTSIGSVTLGANGGLITNAKIAELERVPSSADVGDVSTSLFVTNPLQRERMNTIERGAGDGFLLDSSGKVLGHTLVSTPRVPANLSKGTATTIASAIIFGDFSEVVLAEFGGGFSLTVDPYTRAPSGLVRLTASMYLDVGILRPTAFAAIKDAL